MRDPRTARSVSEAKIAGAFRRPLSDPIASRVKAADAVDSQAHDEEQFCAVDHIMEILRAAGYDCKVLQAKPDDRH